jgi:hypothetical protein
VWTCGDANHDGYISVSDITYLLYHLNGDGPKPIPPEAGDADCNRAIDRDDAEYIMPYVFADGPEPCAECP